MWKTVAFRKTSPLQVLNGAKNSVLDVHVSRQKGTNLFQLSSPINISAILFINRWIINLATYSQFEMSRVMRFPTMWCVRPAKPQISLRIRAV